jgi:hypothetical protein
MNDIHGVIATFAEHYRFTPTPDFIDLKRSLAEFLRWLIDLVSAIFNFVPGSTDSKAVSEFIRILVYLSGIIAAFALIWLVFTRLSELNKQARLASVAPTIELEDLSANGWRLEAWRLRDEKHWQQACRALLVSSLHLFDEKQILSFSANRTNSEYYNTIPKNQGLRQAFKSLADRVDLIWFGNKAAAETDFLKCLSDLDLIDSAMNNHLIVTSSPHTIVPKDPPPSAGVTS